MTDEITYLKNHLIIVKTCEIVKYIDFSFWKDLEDHVGELFHKKRKERIEQKASLQIVSKYASERHFFW